MTFVVKKRCVRCRQVVREDGSCQNPDCVLYVSEITATEKENAEKNN